jgi:transcriptional antiterminator
VYKNLLAEMARTDVSNHMLAEKLNLTDKSIRNKLNGITGFSWQEVKNIHKLFFPTLDIQYLFE